MATFKEDNQEEELNSQIKKANWQAPSKEEIKEEHESREQSRQEEEDSSLRTETEASIICDENKELDSSKPNSIACNYVESLMIKA